MLKQLLIFIALFTICFCQKVNVYNCSKPSKEDFENKVENNDFLLEINDCSGDTCVIHKGKNNKAFSINFKSRRGCVAANVRIEVWARFHLADRLQIEEFTQYEQKICGSETAFKSVQIDQNKCIDNFEFKKDTTHTLKYTMKIVPFLLPTSKVELMLRLLDEGLDKSDKDYPGIVSCGYFHAMFED